MFAEPIKIIKHPRSQTANEGAKVELKCKVQGKYSRLLYQWFKDDGSAVLGQNEDSLVLKSVELRDFGRYTCCVSYADNFGEGKKSSPAKLDVITQNQNGMSKYCVRAWLKLETLLRSQMFPSLAARTGNIILFLGNKKMFFFLGSKTFLLPKHVFYSLTTT